jgi:Flp pilus assembly protein TadD
MDRRKWVLLSLLAVTVSPSLHAQTYKVSPESAPSQKVDNAQAPASQKSLGWGSNIQNARLARAAELALKDGKYAAALDYAQRASQGAPNDPQLWFLLGYANYRSTPTIRASA